jgi:hypothetical protein
LNLSCSPRCLHTVRILAAALIGAVGLALATFGGVDTDHGTPSLLGPAPASHGTAHLPDHGGLLGGTDVR